MPMTATRSFIAPPRGGPSRSSSGYRRPREACETSTRRGHQPSRHRLSDRLAGENGLGAEIACVGGQRKTARQALGDRPGARRGQPVGGAEDEDVRAFPVRAGDEKITRPGRLEAPREEDERLGGAEETRFRDERRL